jgi:hypothetical protein
VLVSKPGRLDGWRSQAGSLCCGGYKAVTREKGRVTSVASNLDAGLPVK